MSSTQLKEFVEKATQRGMSNEELTELLVEEGWSRAEVASSLYGDDFVVPHGSHEPSTAGRIVAPSDISAPSRHTNEPIAVVQNLSTRGFEYIIMFVSLWAAAFSLGGLLHQLTNSAFGSTSSSEYAYESEPNYSLGVTVLIVTLPIFVTMFLRLKKAEINLPSIRKDSSRKKFIQFTQLIAFLVGIGYVIYFVYSLMNGDMGSEGAQSLGELFAHLLITLTIAGGIFGYYWADEHRAANGE